MTSQPLGKAAADAGECAAEAWDLVVVPAALEGAQAAHSEQAEDPAEAVPVEEDLVAALAEVAAVSEAVVAERVVGAAIAPR